MGALLVGSLLAGCSSTTPDETINPGRFVVFLSEMPKNGALHGSGHGLHLVDSPNEGQGISRQPRRRIRRDDVEAWDDPRGELEEITGRRSVPQIVIGDTRVGGFDDLLALHADGVLDELLNPTVEA